MAVLAGEGRVPPAAPVAISEGGVRGPGVDVEISPDGVERLHPEGDCQDLGSLNNSDTWLAHRAHEDPALNRYTVWEET